MKFKTLLFVTTIFFIACNTDKKATEISKQVLKLKSDVLLQSSAIPSFSEANSNDFIRLTLSGKTILESTATLKVTNAKGEELHCKTFPVKELIQPEYRTANSTLQAAHIREVVEGLSEAKLNFQTIMDNSLARL